MFGYIKYDKYDKCDKYDRYDRYDRYDKYRYIQIDTVYNMLDKNRYELCKNTINSIIC